MRTFHFIRYLTKKVIFVDTNKAFLFNGYYDEIIPIID
jgi:hypothetical protein